MATFENTTHTASCPTGGSSVRPSDVLLVALLCAAPLALSWTLTRQLLSVIFTNDTYTHIPLIPVVSVFLIFTEREAIFARTSRGWKLGGALLLAGATALAAARLTEWHTYPANQLSLLAFGFVLVWVGSFVLLFGLSALRAAIFPLLFLLFAVPIPEPILSNTIYLLQKGSAETTAAIFRLIGIPVFQTGFVMALPGVTIRVAEECSGIRSTLALVITAVLAGHLFLRSAPKTLLLVVLIFPLAIFKNALRIVTLSCLAIYVYPQVFQSKLHTYGGVPFFFMGLVVLGLVLVALQRLGTRTRPRDVALT